MDFERKALSPKLTSEPEDGKKANRRELRRTFDTLLRIDQCADAVAEFKGNGIVRGHKVLDNDAAVRALIDAAEKLNLHQPIKDSPLDDWTKCQVLDVAIRYQHELDKKGKLTGNPSKRLIAAREKQAMLASYVAAAEVGSDDTVEVAAGDSTSDDLTV